MKKLWVFAAALAALLPILLAGGRVEARARKALQVGRAAVSNASMVGTWRLIAVHSWLEKEKDKVNNEAYGPHPGGLITYTADGRMSVLETYDGRKALSADREAAPMAERAEAFSSMVAYAGSYTFDGEKVVHHIEVAAAPGPNRDQVRYVTFQDHDHVSLRTPPVMRNGVAEIHEMFWERVRDRSKR